MANSTFYNSGPSGFSQPTTGSSSSWDDFYSGITPRASSRPTAAQMQAIRDVPSSYSSMDRLPGASAQTWDRRPSGEYVMTYNGVPQQNPAVAAATQVAAAPNYGPGPMPRPGTAPTAIDMAAINAQQPGMPPGQLQALLQAAQGLGGLLPGGGAPAPAAPAPQSRQIAWPDKATYYNAIEHVGQRDWREGIGGTYSPTLMNEQSGPSLRASSLGGSPSGSKTAGGRDKGFVLGQQVGPRRSR